MKLKHTPGKWEVVKLNNQETGWAVAIRGSDFPGGRSYIEIATSLIKANAKLIAAAPDMLELMIATYKEEQYMIEVEGYTGTSDFIWNHENKKAIIERAIGMSIEKVIQSDIDNNRNGEGYQKLLDGKAAQDVRK